jgi:hypothetical protein
VRRRVGRHSGFQQQRAAPHHAAWAPGSVKVVRAVDCQLKHQSAWHTSKTGRPACVTAASTAATLCTKRKIGMEAGLHNGRPASS